VRRTLQINPSRRPARLAPKRQADHEHGPADEHDRPEPVEHARQGARHRRRPQPVKAARRVPPLAVESWESSTGARLTATALTTCSGGEDAGDRVGASSREHEVHRAQREIGDPEDSRRSG